MRVVRCIGARIVALYVNSACAYNTFATLVATRASQTKHNRVLLLMVKPKVFTNIRVSMSKST